MKQFTYMNMKRMEGKKKFGPFLDLCVSSLRRGHANLLCIVPILSDVPEGTSLLCSLCHIFCQRDVILLDVVLLKELLLKPTAQNKEDIIHFWVKFYLPLS
ncbi:hypothetical protein S245_011901 [Arachis hypogaea]